MLDEDEHYRSKGFVVGPGVFVSDVPLFDEVLRVIVDELRRAADDISGV